MPQISRWMGNQPAEPPRYLQMEGADRNRRHPWLPILATLFAGAPAVTAGKYLLHTVPKVDKAWCPYCIVGALTDIATVALTLRGPVVAVRRLVART